VTRAHPAILDSGRPVLPEPLIKLFQLTALNRNARTIEAGLDLRVRNVVLLVPAFVDEPRPPLNTVFPATCQRRPLELSPAAAHAAYHGEGFLPIRLDA
jgi:hypothetical protein